MDRVGAAMAIKALALLEAVLGSVFVLFTATRPLLSLFYSDHHLLLMSKRPTAPQ